MNPPQQTDQAPGARPDPKYDALVALFETYVTKVEMLATSYPGLGREQLVDEMLKGLRQKAEGRQKAVDNPWTPPGFVTSYRAEAQAIRDQLAAWERPEPVAPTVDQILAAGASAKAPAEAPVPPLVPARARSPEVGARVREQPAKGKREPRTTAPIEYKTGGYHNVPNLMTDNLLDVIPGPVLKAYIFCTRIADSDASFYVSHGTIARKIGAKDRRHGERVMRRLLDAGLVRQKWRGGPHRANGYTLAGLAAMDFEKARKVLVQPLAPHRGTGPRDRPCTGPTDPTTQT